MDDEIGSERTVTTDRERIRAWFREREAEPAVRTGSGAGNDSRLPFVAFPDDADREEIEETTWEEFFRLLDERDLAVARHSRWVHEDREFEIVDSVEAVERTTGTAPDALAEAITTSTRELGKSVVDADGERIGVVTEVIDGELRVDPDPGLAASVRRLLGLEADEALSVEQDDIAEITEAEVRLRE